MICHLSRRLPFPLAPLLLLFGFSFLQAGLVGGAWNNSLYLRDDRVDTTRPMLGFYENLDLYAKKISGSDLSLYTNVNYSKDFGSTGLKAFELTNLYLDWEAAGKPISLRAGRQRGFEGNTPAYFDGVRLKANVREKVLLTASGGVKIPSRYSDLFIEDKVDKGVVDLVLRADYRLKNGLAGLIYQNDIRYFKTLGQDLGAFYSRDFNDRLYGRANVVYDLAARDIRTFQLLSTYRASDKLTLDAEVSKEAFKIDSSSIFQMKIFKAYKQGSVNGYYALPGERTVMAGYLLRRFDFNEELAHEITARLMSDRCRLLLRQDLGYGGAATQAEAGVRVFQTGMASAELTAGLLRSDSSEVQTDPRMAYHGGLVLDLGPRFSAWGVKLDGQVLRNAYYDYDLRLYASTIVRFSRFSK